MLRKKKGSIPLFATENQDTRPEKVHMTEASLILGFLAKREKQESLGLHFLLPK
jgi:hypothetical protein